jgi:hypothetical protein
VKTRPLWREDPATRHPTETPAYHPVLSCAPAVFFGLSIDAPSQQRPVSAASAALKTEVFSAGFEGAICQQKLRLDGNELVRSTPGPQVGISGNTRQSEKAQSINRR